ncbi:2-phosphosulfolactate phosphatase [Marinicrinis sediminis]|uniref:Probable 2-phosphosulfolactate phosphatase n=1 Tax=Marinicrinis sediminis TaxID=1652465 RepID=A0ABW5RDH1_9BACL
MKIHTLHYIEGAKQAKGIAVIIDVFRAFTMACYMSDQDAKRIIPVGDLAHAHRLKAKYPQSVLIGERGGTILPGFDYGNSPAQIKGVSFAEKTVIHTTSAGTQGLVHAGQADEVLTGSFVNAGAIVSYIQQKAPAEVSLVCMGWGGQQEADEDTLCAAFLRDRLLGKETRFAEISAYLQTESKTESFLRLANDPSAPPEDFHYCMQLDAFPFVLKANWHPENEHLQLERIPVEQQVSTSG